MNNTKKAIHIILDKNKLKKILPEKDTKSACGEIKDFLRKENFFYKKGIGFVSRNPVSFEEVEKTINSLNENLPWLKKCISKCYCEEIGDTTDFTSFLKG